MEAGIVMYESIYVLSWVEDISSSSEIMERV